MDYISIIEENAYRYEIMIRQIETQAFLQECVALAEGGPNVIEKISYIQEAATDKTQSFFSKFTAWVAGIWNKFVTRAERLFATNVKFLTDNKEIILGKKMQDGTISMASNCDECVKHLQEKNTIIFPDVNFMDDLAKRVADGTGEAGIAEWRKDIEAYVTNKKIKADKSSFADACRAYYCPGENVEVNTSKINLADLYNFCMNSNSFKDGLSKTKSNFDKWMQKAERNFNSKYKDVSKSISRTMKNSNNAAPAADAQQTAPAGNDKNAQQGAADESWIYSTVLESVITEAEVNFNNNATNNNGEPNGKYINRNSSYGNQRTGVTNAGDVKSANQQTRDNLKTQSAQTKTANQQTAEKVGAYANANGNAKEDAAAAKAFTKQVSAYCKIVTETTGTVIGAMCTGCERITREYMSIITAHVMSYTGKQDNPTSNAGNVAADTTTNMNSGGGQNISGGAVPGIK